MTKFIVKDMCPYCDNKFELCLNVQEGTTVYCPACGSVLGYARVSVVLDWNKQHEDVDFIEQYCRHCKNIDSTGECCRKQNYESAEYGAPGCKFEQED